MGWVGWVTFAYALLLLLAGLLGASLCKIARHAAGHERDGYILLWGSALSQGRLARSARFRRREPPTRVRR
jgi:hypothetical protein